MSLRDETIERFKIFYKQKEREVKRVTLYFDYYARLLPEMVTDTPQAPPALLFGATVFLHHDATRPIIELE